ARRPRALLLDRMRAAGIPCGEVLGLLEALQSQRTADAGLLTRYSEDGAQDVPVLSPPYRLDGARVPVRRVPPGLAQHTDDVLGELLGLDADRIAALRQSGAL
ncbi:MAG: CoA transferase, partial [Gammaproteobacteria bacterium]